MNIKNECNNQLKNVYNLLFKRFSRQLSDHSLKTIISKYSVWFKGKYSDTYSTKIF